MSWYDKLLEIGSDAADAYGANQEATATRKAANAQLAAANTTATASVMSSRNLMIAAGVVALAILAFVFIRSGKS